MPDDRQAVRTLCRDRKRPLDLALADFFDACWSAGLKDQVQTALEALGPQEKSNESQLGGQSFLDRLEHLPATEGKSDAKPPDGGHQPGRR